MLDGRLVHVARPDDVVVEDRVPRRGRVRVGTQVDDRVDAREMRQQRVVVADVDAGDPRRLGDVEPDQVEIARPARA